MDKDLESACQRLSAGREELMKTIVSSIGMIVQAGLGSSPARPIMSEVERALTILERIDGILSRIREAAARDKS